MIVVVEVGGGMIVERRVVTEIAVIETLAEIAVIEILVKIVAIKIEGAEVVVVMAIKIVVIPVKRKVWQQ